MRRILVTGANKGIGLALTEAILEQHDDTHVLLGARSRERGQKALAQLVKEHPTWSERVELVTVDVSSDSSIESAAAEVARRHGSDPAPLYAVVNNAGIGLGAGDLRAVLEVNLFGLRRVCEAFVPLVDPENGRVVNTTSASGPNFVSRCSESRQSFFVDPNVEWADIDQLLRRCLSFESQDAFAAEGLDDGDPYGLSKACANSYTMLLARQHPALRINASTPGFIDTDLTRPYALSEGKSAADLGMKKPAEGTRSALVLLFGEPDGNGNYYGSDGLRSPLHHYRAPGDPPYTGGP